MLEKQTATPVTNSKRPLLQPDSALLLSRNSLIPTSGRTFGHISLRAGIVGDRSAKYEKAKEMPVLFCVGGRSLHCHHGLHRLSHQGRRASFDPTISVCGGGRRGALPADTRHRSAHASVTLAS